MPIRMLKTAMWRILDPCLRRFSDRIKFLEMIDAQQLPLGLAPYANLRDSVVLHPEASLQVLSKRDNAIIVGERTHIRGELLTFWDGGQIEIGSDCYVGNGSRIWSQQRVQIGSHVLISHLVDIHDTNGHPIDFR